MDLIALCPGQGSQKPGMGKDLAAAHPSARDVFAQADAALGESLSTLCFDGPAETLTLTHNAQPALLTHSAAVWSVIGGSLRPHLRATAGHSLGEFSAWHLAGGLPLADAVQLVRKRGMLMYETGLARPGAMAAILGETSEPIEAICAAAAQEAGLVVPANYNCPGQLVISGEVAGVRRAMELCKAAGAKRAVELPVSGAFHSPLMTPAHDGLSAALGAAGFTASHVPVCANVDASLVQEPSDARRLLLEQLTAPVRWIAVIEQLAARWPEALFVEIGTGAVLAGLVKKIAPSVALMSCGTPADIDQLMARVL